MQRLHDLMDPTYPAAVVEAPPATIGEPSRWYDGRTKSEFVLADDEGWRPL